MLSIGYNCTPRIFMKNAYGLSKAEGQPSCPFDLCITPLDAMLEMVKTDFEGFFDGLHLQRVINAGGERRHAGRGQQNIVNKCGIIFNHESSTHSHLFREGKDDDHYYTADNFRRFRDRYEQRIANWRAQLQAHPHITLVCTLPPEEDTHPQKVEERIQDILHVFRTTYPTTSFELIIAT